ncbi:DUF4177 domain-containing protein [Oscillibacter hominis]|uniref:DUF4177 domain-containing protein n=1 Tax=Oscillibacter hominis TaxID=2763056 RepID=A0A7G9B2K9_9FIRM|nr:DUF4177 domain-containing protein [Oscillibacter hominis]QNL43790.1 DUF4177 domain-containing protein [Oscillibacter hominis]
MYEYQYIELHVGGGFWIDNSQCAHRDLIEEQAKAGWRYVGYIPSCFTGNGGIKDIDLIFERRVDAGSNEE